jgi:putative ABC transport system permease protein
MILSLAWKNIWRSKRRSFVVMSAVAIGVWSLIFMVSFYNSMMGAISRNSLQHDYSHIQIHHEGYLSEPGLDFQVKNPSTLMEFPSQISDIEAASGRLIVNGMVASPKTNLGIQVYAIDPADEAAVTDLPSFLIAGDYFTNIKRNPILLSQKLAEKLKVKVRSKVVITVQDLEANIRAGAFRVSGIFHSKSPRINNGVVYLRHSDLSKLINSTDTSFNEFAYLLKDNESLIQTKIIMEAKTKNLVRTYREIAPEFDMIEEGSAISKQVITVIVMLALLFGIINTMLMAVLERTKEIGMLRAIGMFKRKIFLMIVLETFMISLVSAPVGLTAGFLTNRYFERTGGMDLSQYAGALEQYGGDVIFYPELGQSTYLLLMLVVMMTALIGAIYPAIKAVNLEPLEAIRKL